jgi:hypothetical protein
VYKHIYLHKALGLRSLQNDVCVLVHTLRTMYCLLRTTLQATSKQANIGEIASSVIGSSGDAVNAATAKTGSIVRNGVPKSLPDASELVPAEVIAPSTKLVELSLLR